ncbi:tail fiber protein [Staphylococcus phage Alsa_3]|nr:tail fiber protein [Staphylococcus phage Alsa_2]WNM50916.1 tail fiber protein [Staphylococcus phage Alsa_3]WNM51168.1 tail fiber protein [Staphylococcus phage Alsa_4]WNM56067.1 tail fiber protein [Staphylococcus phage S-CoN_Ph38]
MFRSDNLDPYGAYLENGYDSPYADESNPERITQQEIDNISLEDYGWTADAIKNYFMFGIDIKDENGNEMDETFYRYLFEQGIAEAEQALDIVILPRVETEIQDYNEQEFQSYMHVHTRRKPIIQVESLSLQMNGSKIYDYPGDWWKVYHLPGHLQIFPTTLMQAGNNGYNSNVFMGYPAQIGAMPGGFHRTFAPQMIRVKYIAGLLPRKQEGITREYEIPANLQTLVTSYAMRELFKVGGRLIIGAGIASRTLTIDGVSETINTTQSAMYGGYSAEILQIDQDIDKMLGRLRSYFGQNMISL